MKNYSLRASSPVWLELCAAPCSVLHSIPHTPLRNLPAVVQHLSTNGQMTARRNRPRRTDHQCLSMSSAVEGALRICSAARETQTFGVTAIGTVAQRERSMVAVLRQIHPMITHSWQGLEARGPSVQGKWIDNIDQPWARSLSSQAGKQRASSVQCAADLRRLAKTVFRQTRFKKT